jgi:hypothetical protein
MCHAFIVTYWWLSSHLSYTYPLTLTFHRCLVAPYRLLNSRRYQEAFAILSRQLNQYFLGLIRLSFLWRHSRQSTYKLWVSAANNPFDFHLWFYFLFFQGHLIVIVRCLRRRLFYLSHSFNTHLANWLTSSLDCLLRFFLINFILVELRLLRRLDYGVFSFFEFLLWRVSPYVANLLLNNLITWSLLIVFLNFFTRVLFRASLNL